MLGRLSEWSCRVKTGNKFLKRVEKFKYFGTTVTNQYFIHKEIKSSLKSENVCYHSVQNFLISVSIQKM
jgi:hypothetical protein